MCQMWWHCDLTHSQNHSAVIVPGKWGHLRIQLPRLHGDPIAGSNPEGGSDPSSGVALTRVYTVIPFTEQTPQLGQIGCELGVYITKCRLANRSVFNRTVLFLKFLKPQKTETFRFWDFEICGFPCYTVNLKPEFPL